jgi:GNAT superfamily N-acetyltransferase
MPQGKVKDAIKIRRAKRRDAAHLAVLAGQLGYPSTTAQITERLRNLSPISQHALFVAEVQGSASYRSSQTRVIGWVHVSAVPLMDNDLRAEVNSLIVAEGERSLGAGAQLLKTAEEWGRKHGCTGMNVRSNVVRERAHRFYERNGYEHYKTQKAFRKLF